MTRRKIHQSPIPTHPSVSSVINSHRISPAFLGHTCPQDVQNSINFHRDTLSEEVCQFLSSRVHNLPSLCEFWSRPQYAPLTSGRAADTICGASWMLALNYLFLGQLHMAGAFTLNGAFIQQTLSRYPSGAVRRRRRFKSCRIMFWGVGPRNPRRICKVTY